MGNFSVLKDANPHENQIGDGKLFKPLLTKRILVVSSPPEKVTYQINVAKEHAIPALFGKSGNSKVRVQLFRDAY